MTPQPASEWDVTFDAAVALSYEDAVAGLKLLESLHDRLCRLDSKELLAQGGRLRLLSEKTVKEMVGLLSMKGKYQEALDLVETEELRTGRLRTDHEFPQVPNRVIAFLKFNLGRGREAAELLLETLNEAQEPSSFVLPSYFFPILQYRQFDLARAWLAAKRDPDATTAEWLTPIGVSLLYRLEAQLLLEEGQHERVIIAFDKAVSANKANRVYPNGIAEDLIMAGRPNMGLRLNRLSVDGEQEKLWTAIALRMRGKNDEAQAVLEEISDKPMPGDEFRMQAWILAACYAGRANPDLLEALEMYIAEGADFEDVLYFTLGIVAGVVGKDARVRHAFERAMLETRFRYDGHLLNRQHWFHVQQLFGPALQKNVLKYFDPTLMPVRFL